MREIVLSNQFKKDLKKAVKRGYPIDRLDRIVTRIAAGETLEPQYRVHPLTGNYSGFLECHIEPDWLLIYRLEEDNVYLFLFRTGTHSDVFE